MDMSHPEVTAWGERDAASREQEVTEVGLILPVPHVAALEAEAHRLGLTTGELVRWLIRDFLN